MCFGLAFMLAVVILGGAYLYKYFQIQVGWKYVYDQALNVFVVNLLGFIQLGLSPYVLI